MAQKHNIYIWNTDIWLKIIVIILLDWFLLTFQKYSNDAPVMWKLANSV